MKASIVLILSTALLSACAMTPEREAALRDIAAGLNSGAQNVSRQVEENRRAFQYQQSRQPLNCMTTYSGNTARTYCN